MRLTALTWPFPFGVRLGWATCSVPNPTPGEEVGRVYLLRGMGAVFSVGFGRIADALRRAGWWTEDLRCVGDVWLRKHLRKEKAAGRLRGPLVFVGHSCGGRYALYSAQQLAQDGIQVDLLMCVDVAWAFPVAANVRQAVHLYRSRWRLYPAKPLLPAPGANPRIANVDIDAEPTLRGWGMCHLNVTAYATVQEAILTRIRSLTPASRRSTHHAA